MTTEQAILWTQIPIAFGIIVGSYMLHKISKELEEIAEVLRK